MVVPSTLNVALPTNAIFKTFIFSKSVDKSWLYICSRPYIMSFMVNVFLVLAPPVKNKCIGLFGYNLFLCILSSKINLYSSFSFLRR